MHQNLTHTVINKILEQFPKLYLGILYGSSAEGNQQFDSDIDLAVAGKSELFQNKQKEIIETLAIALKRPIDLIDLIDLQQINGTLLHQILTKGKLIYCTDRVLYAELIKKMLFNQADMMPYHHRILKERRERWINE